jgi:hypothetical protein
MYQKFTHNGSEDCCRVVEKDFHARLMDPRNETLALIMQFACAYHVEKKLPTGLSGLILN